MCGLSVSLYASSNYRSSLYLSPRPWAVTLRQLFRPHYYVWTQHRTVRLPNLDKNSLIFTLTLYLNTHPILISSSPTFKSAVIIYAPTATMLYYGRLRFSYQNVKLEKYFRHDDVTIGSGTDCAVQIPGLVDSEHLW